MNTDARLSKVRGILRRHGLDGWLFTGGPGLTDPAFAAAFPGARPAHPTRRFAYLVPADEVQPVRVMSSVESGALADLPGTVWIYHNRDQWKQAMRALVDGHERLAVQYSPGGRFPATDVVPAGWLETLRECGGKPEPSAPLLASLAVLSADELASHERAAAALVRALRDALHHVEEHAGRGRTLTELEVQVFLRGRVEAAGLVLDAGPIVAFGDHTADPHWTPSPDHAAPLQRDEVALLDVWAREPGEESVFADVTWMAVMAEEVPQEVDQLFGLLCRARDQGLALVDGAARAGRPVTGADVDAAVRAALEPTHHDQYFLHRTGHSLGTEVHGPGVNLDSVETFDDRPLLPGTAFTIEPGVYLPGRLGLRTEVDVLFEAAGARVTTLPPQTRPYALLA